jgi:sugar lactone lactonase YvrE
MQTNYKPTSRNGLFFSAALALALFSQAAYAQSPQILSTVTIVANATTAGFSAKLSAATADANGNIYATDTGTSIVYRIDPKGNVTTFAGGATTPCSTATNAADGDGCLATQAILNGPTVVRFYKGDAYILDVGNNRVRVVNGKTGIISTYAGDGTNTEGTATKTVVPTSTGCTAASAAPKISCGLGSPTDMAFDHNGNLYVVTANQMPIIQRIDWASKLQTYFAGAAKSSPVATLGDTLPIACPANTAVTASPTTCASFNTPTGIAVDATGNVYLAEGQAINNVRLLPPGGNAATYVGLSGVGTSAVGTDGNPAAGQSDLKMPASISFDAAGNLYIADSGNFRIRKVTPGTNGVISTIVGSGVKTGTTDGQVSVQAALSQPNDIEFTPAGDMLVTDRGNSDVLLVAPGGHFAATTVATAAPTQTIYVNTVAATGTFTLANSSDFTISSTTCAASTVYGASGEICQATITFTPTAAGYRKATAIFTDSTGASVQSDLTGIGTASAVALLPGTASTLAGTGVAGSSGDGSTATAAKLNMPVGTALDSAGNLYVADTGNDTIRKITPSGTISIIAGQSGTAGFAGDGSAASVATLNAPTALAVDGAGNIYIADTGNNRVRLINVVSRTISTFAGTGTAGYTGDSFAPATAQLNHPSGLALSLSGILYIADTGNNVVRYAGIRGGSMGTYAGTGTAAYAGDSGLASAASLSAPSGLAVDPTGTLFIADTGNSVIRSVNTSGSIATVAGNNVAGFNGDGSALAFSLNAPKGLAVDAGDNLYIADTGNNRVRVVSAGSLFTVGGLATSGSAGDNGVSTLASFNAPQGIALDATGDLILADTANNKVREISTTSVSLLFPKTNPTSTSVAQTEVVLNSGNAPLTIASPTLPTAFVQQSSGVVDCPNAGSVAMGAFCNLQLAFDPPSVGPFSGNVTLTDNAQLPPASTGATQSIAVSGTGEAVFAASFATGFSTQTTAGASQSVAVSVVNPNATYLGTIHFTSSDPKAVLPPDYTFTSADAGLHTFTGIVLKTAGIQTVTVTDTTDSTITATTSTTVVAGAVTKLSIVSGNNQSVDIMSHFQPLSVVATDAFGNLVPSAAITFTAPSTGTSLTFANGTMTDSETTANNGTAQSTTPTPNAATGTYSVRASSGSASVNIALTNTSSVPPGFNVTPLTSNAPYGLQPGGTETVTLSLTSVGGFQGTVNLTCTSPAASACTVAPTSLAMQIGTPTPFQLTLTTQRNADTNARTGPLTGIACGIFGVALWGLRRKKKLAGFLLLLLSLGTLSLMGCSGNTAKSANSPYGLYNVTVTATSGTLSSSGTVTFYVPST